MKAVITLVITCDYEPLDDDDKREHVKAVDCACKSIVHEAQLLRNHLAAEARLVVSSHTLIEGA